MYKFLLIFALIFSAAICAAAQNEPEKFKNWQTFASASEEFTIEAPESFALRRKSEKSRSYTAFLEGTYFFVFSDKLKSPFQTKKVLEFAKNYSADKSSSAVSNFAGEKISFIDDEGFYHTIFIVETERRSYVFQTTSENKNNSAAERFFASIRFNGRLEQPTERLEESETSNVEAPIVQKKPDEQKKYAGYENEIGVGIGNGIGSGNASLRETKIQPNQISPLKILSKPRANYTDLARFYEITGSVMLKVTFSNDGTIGAMTAVKKLPFGLTKTAADAARSIRFEPRVEDGKTVVVRKLVEYNFTIY